MARLKVTLKRSLIGRTQRQRQTAKGLGLSRPNTSVIVEDTPSTRGMINKVSHLVDVTEVDET